VKDRYENQPVRTVKIFSLRATHRETVFRQNSNKHLWFEKVFDILRRPEDELYRITGARVDNTALAD
jgi:hypothetical protein